MNASWLRRVAAMVMLVWVGASEARAEPFTYQGVLEVGGVPAHGVFDLRFELFESDGTPTGLVALVDDLDIAGGVFSAEVDFGTGAFVNGSGQTIQVSVREGASGGAYEPLSPRTPVNTVPVAQHALSQEVHRDGGTLLMGDADDRVLINPASSGGFFVNTSPLMQLNFPGPGFGGMYINGQSPSSIPYLGFAVQNLYRAYIGYQPSGGALEFWVGSPAPVLSIDIDSVGVGGDLSVDGVVTADYAGVQEQISPVAFGAVRNLGNPPFTSGSGNYTVVYNDVDFQYEITIDQEAFVVGDYTVLVTVESGPGVKIPAYTSFGGDLIVRLFNLGGGRERGSFSFVVYRN